MSTEGLAVPFLGRQSENTPKERHPVIRLYQRFNPSQGWITFIFLLLMLMILGDSVASADWVETPGLFNILFLSALLGLGLAKVKIPAVFLHPIALVAGFVVVVWRTLSVTDDDTITGAFAEMWSRLNTWYEAATSDGISTDLLPFTLTVLAIAWITGYLSSWFIFRSNNVWIAVVLGGTAVLTNLSFLPERFGSRFFLFVFFAMLLIVRMSVVQRQELWRSRGVQFNLVNGWLAIHAALWFSVLVLLLSAILPMRVYVSQTMAQLWSAGRTPIASLEDDFARLFAGIPSRKDVHGRFFGNTLPFIGAISFGGEVVFWANSEYPSYWLSQTYSEYTSQGWKAGETTELEVGPDIVPPARADGRERISVDQSLQLSFDTSEFLSGGSLDWLSHEAVLGVLSPKKFEVNLLDDSGDAELPSDIQELAIELREELAVPPETFVESFISRILPEDLVLNEVNSYIDDLTGELVLESLELERKESLTPEVVSWTFSETLEENIPYSMISFVSMATDDDLRGASTEYPSFITDHYLQLPITLPDRVAEKASEITANSGTPLDKAVAIQDYLRSEEFIYSQDIEAPPRGADGVDHFLFETKTGYSDYFASTMTVMLRSVGVPARMAAGYAPGELDQENQVRVVRDFDSHGWTQVYFPEYGWIDFEPTTAWPVHERRLTTGPGAEFAESRGIPTFFPDEDELLDPFDELGSSGIGLTGDLGLDDGINIDFVPILTRAGIGLGVIGGVWVLFYIAWNWTLRNATPVEKVYTKMGRLGAFAGLGRRSNYTPVEYATMLGSRVDGIGTQTQTIASAFARTRYRRDTDEDEEVSEDLEKAWREIRGSLFSTALRRLIPGGGNKS